jgi:hypothetical protein
MCIAGAIAYSFDQFLANAPEDDACGAYSADQ